MSSLERLDDLHSGLVYDALLSSEGVDGAVLNAPTPIDQGAKIWGRACVVEGDKAEGVSGHETLLAWTKMLSRPKPGEILIITSRDREPRALMGELSAEALRLADVAGTIVSGGVRDTVGILERGVPTFAVYRTPRDVVASWLPDTETRTTVLGGQSVSNGDFVFADADGIVVVPEAVIETTLATAFQMLAAENKVQTAIRQGETAETAYLEFGKF